MTPKPARQSQDARCVPALIRVLVTRCSPGGEGGGGTWLGSVLSGERRRGGGGGGLAAYAALPPPGLNTNIFKSGSVEADSRTEVLATICYSNL